MIRLLYVDDEPDLLMIGKIFLEREGSFQVDTISSASAALAQMESTTYDAIISDYEMPKINGIEFLKTIRTSWNTLPFILFTGRGREEVVIQALNEGADFYLQKGGDPRSQFAELSHKVHQAVYQRQTEEAIRLANVKLQQQATTLSVLNTIITTVNRTETMEELLQVFLDSTLMLLNYDGGGIYLIDQVSNTASLAYSKNLPDELLAKVRTVATQISPYDSLFVKGQPLITNNYSAVSSTATNYGICSLASIPLSTKGKIIGALNVFSKNRTDITDQEQGTLISIGSELGNTINRMTTEQALRDAYETLASAEEELRGQYEELATTQEELRKQQEQLIEVASTLPGVIYQFYIHPDGSMGMNYVSSRAEEVFGYTGNTSDFFEWFTTHLDPRDRDIFLRTIDEVVLSGSPWKFEGRFITPSERIIWFEGLSRPVRHGFERVYNGVLLDITERKHAEEAIRESEEKYRKLVETTRTGFVIVDAQGRVLDANPEYVRMTGKIDFSQIIGKSVTEWTADSDRQKNADAVSQCYRDGFIRNFETNYIDSSGIITPIEINATVLQSDGSLQIHTLCRDISTRKQAEEALRKKSEELHAAYEEISGAEEVLRQNLDDLRISEKAFHESERVHATMISNLPGFVYRCANDSNWTMEYISEGCLTLTGYSSGELVHNESLTYNDLVHPDYQKSLWDTVQEFLEKKEVFEVEYPIITKTGEIRWVWERGRGIISDDNRLLYLEGFITDITRHRQAEKELRESEGRYRALFQGAAEGILVIDSDTRQIIHANPAICRMLGYGDDDLISMGLENIHPHGDLPQVIRGFDAIIRGDKSRVADIPCLRKDGTIFLTDVTSSRIMIDGRDCVIGLFVDVTDRKQMEEALRQSNLRLRLLTGLTRHDILNHLTAIQGYQSLALETPDHDAVRKYISKAYETGKRIEATIGFTREYEIFGCESSSWRSIFSIIESAKSEIVPGNVIIENTVPSSLEVYADPIIRKVFSTLLENSIRHGKTISRIKFSAFETHEDLILLCEDDGVGIFDEEKERIFEHGFGKNTGIGLFLAREILAITGLSIQECGVSGEGARFEIWVPVGKFRINKDTDTIC